eukprot:scaffold248407_cov75-Cyclotella_meneghiniana.AAC.5
MVTSHCGIEELIGSNSNNPDQMIRHGTREMMIIIGTDQDGMISQSLESICMGILPVDKMTEAMEMVMNLIPAMNKLMHDPSARMKGLESNPSTKKMLPTTPSDDNEVTIQIVLVLSGCSSVQAALSTVVLLLNGNETVF